MCQNVYFTPFFKKCNGWKSWKSLRVRIKGETFLHPTPKWYREGPAHGDAFSMALCRLRPSNSRASDPGDPRLLTEAAPGGGGRPGPHKSPHSRGTRLRPSRWSAELLCCRGDLPAPPSPAPPPGSTALAPALSSSADPLGRSMTRPEL